MARPIHTYRSNGDVRRTVQVLGRYSRVSTGKTYAPNGKREMARRLRMKEVARSIAWNLTEDARIEHMLDSMVTA